MDTKTLPGGKGSDFLRVQTRILGQLGAAGLRDDGKDFLLLLWRFRWAGPSVLMGSGGLTVSG